MNDLGFASRVAADPLSALFACVTWIPLAIWGVLIVGWMVSKDLDFFNGVIALIAILTLAGFTINPPEPWLAPVSFLTLVGSLLLYPFVSHLNSVRELKLVERERLLGLLENYEDNPSNFVALFRIGESLARQGLGSYGIPLAERALRSLPESHFREEHRILHQLRATSTGSVTQLHCPGCSLPLPYGEVDCPRCRCNVLKHHLFGRPESSTVIRLVVALATTSTLTLLALVTLPAQSQLPVLLRIVVLTFALVFGVYVVYKSLSPVLTSKA